VLVNIHHDSAKEHNRLFVAGVAFVAAIALLIWFSIAIYNKEFERVTTVTVKADRAGLQLAKFGDVRLNGALVGYVKGISQDGEQAEITLALEPDSAEVIPDNVNVEILPTTLFGQKFVQLVKPEVVSSASLRDGSVIPADRVDTNVELSKILADLFPLLRSVRPADLNRTLNALATALDGRGEDLGETLVQLGDYLGEIDDHLPTLERDLEALADVSDAYADAAPDLLDVLDNITVTSKTITQKAKDLDVFFSDLTGLARTTTRVLGDNEAGLIRVGQVGAPVMALLADYSPQLPCLLQGAADYAPILARTFEGNQVKQYIQVLGNSQGHVYTEKDLPEFGEVGHGPWCLGMPGNPVYKPNLALDNGTDVDENPPTSPIPHLGVLPTGDVDSGYAGTEGEQQIVNALLADRTGREAASYGSLGSLLYGPVVREEAQG
jgi:phospholipid/cholesterol/gamma-HCH transport system substrate-binding protein